MSWFSKQLKSTKKMFTHPKAWAGNAAQTAGQIAPYALAAAPFAGGALSAVKRLLPGGGNIRVPQELDMGKIFSGLPGMPSPTTTFPGSRGGFDWANAAQTLTGGKKQGGGGFDFGSLLSGAGSFLKNNAVDIGIGGLAGYQALNAANASKRAGGLQDKAISGVEKRWGDNEALRTEGRRRLLNPTRPDLSSVYNDPTNPFAKRPPPVDATPSGPNVNPIPGAVPLGGQPILPPGIPKGIQRLFSGVPKGIPQKLLPQGVQKIFPQKKRLLPAPY